MYQLVNDIRKEAIGDQEYEKFKEFKYLGRILTEDDNITTEIKQRIIMPNKTSHGLKKQLYSLNLKHQTNCMLYKTLVRPVLTYGSECWSLSKKDGNMLEIFARRILRLIYGAVNDNGVWRTRYNSKLYTLCNEPHTVKVVKTGRLRWLRYLFSMQELDPCK
jgi:hypothetical protein